MRFTQVGLLSCVLLLNVSVWGQQTQEPAIQPEPSPSQQALSIASLPSAPKDLQAVSIVNQALTVAGGASVIKAVMDYTASGTITYHWNPEEQGTVTVQGLGFDQVRFDANLPRGIRSSVISAGQSTTMAEDGTLTQYPPPYPVPSSEAHLNQPPLFPAYLLLPYAQLVLALNSTRFSVLDKGVAEVDGNSVRDIQVQLYTPVIPLSDGMSEYHTIDFFLTPDTMQVVMTQDYVPNHIVHQIRYSDYRLVNGVLVPFSISEQMGGQKTRDIQLSQISFNTGLQDSAFAIK